MDVQYIKRDDNPKSVFNPLKHDFIDTIRGDDNKEVEYIVPSMQIAKFPAWIAERIIKDLIIAVAYNRGINVFLKKEMDKIKEEIEV
jgi:hypothetical protein